MSTLHLGDCVEFLRSLEEASVDAIVTDPPYELTAGKKGGTGPASLNLSSPAGRSRIGTGGGFMGKAWDATGIAHDPVFWGEVFRVLKPGGHLLAAGGTRTVHRLTCAIEDAGFEIRDSVGWVYYSGFPKSLDVSKAIDAAAGAARAVVGPSARHGGGVVGNGTSYEVSPVVPMITAPATPEAVRWSGWGTALKPAIEPFVLARKPLVGTVASNVLEHGTGALNIDGCRLAPGDPAWVGPDDGETTTHHRRGADNGFLGSSTFQTGAQAPHVQPGMALGRWPANLYYCPKAPRAERERGLGPENMLCHCETTREQWANEDLEAAIRAATAPSAPRATTESSSTGASEWPTSSSGSASTGRSRRGGKSTTATRTSSTTGSRTSNSSIPSPTSDSTPGANSGTGSGSSPASSAASSSPSTGSTGTSPERGGPPMGGVAPATSVASSKRNGLGVRVCPRCGKWDRQPRGSEAVDRPEGSAGLDSPRSGAGRSAGGVWCVHPTVKPVRLMRWLCRLVTPPGGLVVDPFLGSGTTGIAAVLEGFRFAGAEREAEYASIAEARIAHARRWPASWSDTDPGSAEAPDDTIETVERAGQIALFGGVR